ncbi:hypothetical protein PQC39_gp081 [Vibrio phage Vp_R1]|uniref:N-acetyltransferase domain-containing protein n=1 Tax=Vibrio phage Vp_R1 TaxID=2059867 RepID=A0A2H5BQ52_9CAUD|nr:hypothetical protein PQC39_gp081 [Vibrio phage Vp_R1]AUG88445.1 hypothetical protein VPR_081 [Vibrio phage Vp_R1]
MKIIELKCLSGLVLETVEMSAKELFKDVISEEFSKFAPHHSDLIIADTDMYFKKYDISVAVSGSLVVGVMMSYYNTLEWLVVKDTYRRSGVGDMLLKHFESKHKGTVELFAYANNPFISFYEKHGYSKRPYNREAVKFTKVLM